MIKHALLICTDVLIMSCSRASIASETIDILEYWAGPAIELTDIPVTQWDPYAKKP